MRPATRLLVLPIAAALLSLGGAQAVAQDRPETPVVEFQDDLSTPADWGTDESESGSIAYEGEQLVIRLAQDDNSLWSWRDLDDFHRTLRVRGKVAIDAGSPLGGLMCGNSDTDFLLGGVNPEEWVVAQVVDDPATSEQSWHTTPLERGPLPPGVDPTSGPVVVEVICDTTGTGADRLVLSVDGELVADTTGPALGPYGLVGVYANVATAPAAAIFDDVVAWSGDETKQSASPEPTSEPVADLLAHVPPAFRADCVQQVPRQAFAEIATLVCTPAGDADQAVFSLYADLGSMDAAFDGFAAAAADEVTGKSCKQGPSELTYTIGDEDAGRLACFPAAGPADATVIVWTDELLSILTQGVDESMAYDELYEWWLGAGPDR